MFRFYSCLILKSRLLLPVLSVIFMLLGSLSTNSTQRDCIAAKKEWFRLRYGAAAGVFDGANDQKPAEAATSICPSKGGTLSCCSEDIERDMFVLSRSQMGEKISDWASLAQQMSNDSSSLISFFRSDLEQAKNRLHTFFSRIYGYNYKLHRSFFFQFFADLDDYVTGRRNNLGELVDEFFTQLRENIVGLILRSSGDSADSNAESLVRCLSDRVAEHQPFDNVDIRLRNRLLEAYPPARMLTNVLAVSGGLMTRLVTLLSSRQECVLGLTRFRYCAVCAGHQLADVCPDSCPRLMSSCLALTDDEAGGQSLGVVWGNLIDAIGLAGTRLEHSFNFPAVNRQLQMEISEAITSLQSRYQKTKSKFEADCRRQASSPSTATGSPPATRSFNSPASESGQQASWMQRASGSEQQRRPSFNWAANSNRRAKRQAPWGQPPRQQSAGDASFYQQSPQARNTWPGQQQQFGMQFGGSPPGAPPSSAQFPGSAPIAARSQQAFVGNTNAGQGGGDSTERFLVWTGKLKRTYSNAKNLIPVNYSSSALCDTEAKPSEVDSANSTCWQPPELVDPKKNHPALREIVDQLQTAADSLRQVSTSSASAGAPPSKLDASPMSANSADPDVLAVPVQPPQQPEASWKPNNLINQPQPPPSPSNLDAWTGQSQGQQPPPPGSYGDVDSFDDKDGDDFSYYDEGPYDYDDVSVGGEGQSPSPDTYNHQNFNQPPSFNNPAPPPPLGGQSPPSFYNPPPPPPPNNGQQPQWGPYQAPPPEAQPNSNQQQGQSSFYPAPAWNQGEGGGAGGGYNSWDQGAARPYEDESTELDPLYDDEDYDYGYGETGSQPPNNFDQSFQQPPIPPPFTGAWNESSLGPAPGNATSTPEQLTTPRPYVTGSDSEGSLLNANASDTERAPATPETTTTSSSSTTTTTTTTTATPPETDRPDPFYQPPQSLGQPDMSRQETADPYYRGQTNWQAPVSGASPDRWPDQHQQGPSGQQQQQQWAGFSGGRDYAGGPIDPSSPPTDQDNDNFDADGQWRQSPDEQQQNFYYDPRNPEPSGFQPPPAPPENSGGDNGLSQWSPSFGGSQQQPTPQGKVPDYDNEDYSGYDYEDEYYPDEYTDAYDDGGRADHSNTGIYPDEPHYSPDPIMPSQPLEPPRPVQEERGYRPEAETVADLNYPPPPPEIWIPAQLGPGQPGPSVLLMRRRFSAPGPQYKESSTENAASRQPIYVMHLSYIFTLLVILRHYH